MDPLTKRNLALALAVTIAIIGTVAYAINYLNRARIVQITDLQSRLTTDTLSVETQFALLAEAPCEYLTENNTLSQEVSELGSRLALAESQLGNGNAQVQELRKQYTLLQIRDYLLTKRLAEKCEVDPTVVLYFYSNKPGACEDCDRAAVALGYLHESNPKLRVYAFDYDLDLGALKTLIAVEKVAPDFPAFVIEGTPTYGFATVDEFKRFFPKDFFATTSATSTSSSTPARKR